MHGSVCDDVGWLLLGIHLTEHASCIARGIADCRVFCNNVGKIKDIRDPVFIVHGSEDEVRIDARRRAVVCN